MGEQHSAQAATELPPGYWLLHPALFYTSMRNRLMVVAHRQRQRHITWAYLSIRQPVYDVEAAVQPRTTRKLTYLGIIAFSGSDKANVPRGLLDLDVLEPWPVEALYLNYTVATGV